jgi:hypothetical protein
LLSSLPPFSFPALIRSLSLRSAGLASFLHSPIPSLYLPPLVFLPCRFSALASPLFTRRLNSLFSPPFCLLLCLLRCRLFFFFTFWTLSRPFLRPCHSSYYSPPYPAFPPLLLFTFFTTCSLRAYLLNTLVFPGLYGPTSLSTQFLRVLTPKYFFWCWAPIPLTLLSLPRICTIRKTLYVLWYWVLIPRCNLLCTCLETDSTSSTPT